MELESKTIPKLKDELDAWFRFVDDTFSFMDSTKIEYVKDTLNAFDKNIQFTSEREKERRINFLDVMIERKEDNCIETSVYTKPTNTDIYINWNAHAPNTWKINTLRNLIKRAKTICSTKENFIAETRRLQKVFQERNQYPKRVVENVINKEIETTKTEIKPNNISQNDNNAKTKVTLTIPYAGKKGENLVKKLRKELEAITENKLDIGIIYKSTKLATKLPVKDKTKLDHIHNVTYHIKCPRNKCKSEYTGQTRCRIAKRINEHNSTDNASHVLQHSKKYKHRRVSLKNVKILGRGYRSDFTRKISESLFIKELKPDLNKQKDSYKLKLFN